MRKIINIIALTLVLALSAPVLARAEEPREEEQLITCMCKGGEQCTHRLPSQTFETFEEWEEYYFAHREIGVYWDSYLYKSCAYKYDADGNVIWKPSLTYPFNDIETWKFWFKTCWEKQRTGEYRYEWPCGKPRK